MVSSRHNIGASRRRRRDEEGEDDASLEGELEDDSMSEGSVISHPDEDDADGEGSDESDAETTSSPRVDRINGHQVNSRIPESSQQSRRRHSASPGKALLATAVSDTEAMMNGLTISDQTSEVAEIHFDDLKGESRQQTGRTPSAPPTETKRETFAERKRREHEKYAKERDENPAFVPTRGSFFLHDKRSTELGANGYRPFNKSKSRPYGLIVDGNVRRSSKTDASEGQWTHDLHETVAGDDAPSNKSAAAPVAVSNFAPKPVPTAPRSAPPNRSFSSTTLIGNVPVVVFLPGMARPVPFPAVSKKQHTRLPHHRPPLRRDKPVRISVPGQSPRYIFPSIERSFIFIPRALRPNQQGYRGRGRGGFYGGRRPSIYASSVYTPSVTASRRSSLGKAASQEGFPSPAASVISRHTVITTENGKPVVRLPPSARPLGGVPPASVAAGPGAVIAPVAPPMPFPQPQHPSYRESRPAPIPMHQPRPQKTVSVADIETPASLSFNVPQPQQEQPFQHQVPVPINASIYGADASGHPSHTAHASVTPSSHIPERAIHAQPFQPYGFQQAQPFYPTAYPPGAVYYPVSGAEYPSYNGAGMPGPSAVPYPPPGQHAPFVVPGSSADQAPQPGTVAHEAGGTVYFYDAAQMYPNGSYSMPSAPGPGGVIGMGGMMTPPGTTYFYPQPQGGVYYAPQ
ncbi:uncharacterized protein ACLA_033800 [Aspergillus clavatus NRRL 1]|uniref:Btz domain-containing protein n=1 Tax=Aspergillus clavatus (strain ATCC 1007 / CBS 513.65 / DSM 816 / NCTC 3887 / NRRL 1 / QM 1276 / 107) TaxID=344612 RepID=A1CJ53_ASPCL|nr:uncharacterized protein ACLA_033800 [Aspergillus clavatus NRRL 1]EAW09177.1 conserved hypothetical protein [Aspergillus clavatus NRRL 1]